MDYKEKYNKLVEAIKVLQEANPSDEGLQNWVNDNVPELKWSEDKIYKRAIRQMYSFLPNKPTYIGNVRVEDIFAWLEKQGSKHLDEQPRYNIGDVICDKSCTTLNKEAQPNMEIVDIKNGMYICDKGSFPVSHQDEYELVSKKIDTKLNDDSVSNELREASFEHARNEMMSTTFPNNMTFEFAYNFEEGAKWHAAQKPTWSEEDIATISRVISIVKWAAYSDHSHPILNDEGATELVERLTSLKDRSTWKPSDEQMDALEYHLKHTNENSRLYKDTKKLYDQLKKLK